MMQKKFRLIPFSWLPGSWGLKGKVFEEASAHYYYEGKDLDYKLAEVRHHDDEKAYARALLDVRRKHKEIDGLKYDLELLKIDVDRKQDPLAYDRALVAIRLKHDDIAPYDADVILLNLLKQELSQNDEAMEDSTYAVEKLRLDFKHGRISTYDCDCQLAKIDHPDEKSVEYQLAIADIDLKHDKISQHDYDKKVATLREEPWIGIIDQGFEPEKGLNGVYFEFDWNEYWIIFLRMNGYVGNTEDQIVDMWFNDVCRSQGVGVNEYDDGTVIPFNGRIVNKTPDR